MHLTNSQLRQMILEQLEAGPDPELIRGASFTMAQLQAGAMCGTHSEIKNAMSGLNRYLDYFNDEEYDMLLRYRDDPEAGMGALLTRIPEFDPRNPEETNRDNGRWGFVQQLARHMYDIYEKAGLIDPEAVMKQTKQLATCEQENYLNEATIRYLIEQELNNIEEN